MIIVNGEKIHITNFNNIINKSNIVICADGGISWASEINIKVDAIIGDLDSASEDVIKLYEKSGTRIIKAPQEKDETDGSLAVDYALLQGATDVTILGATGGRLDHQYGNIMLLKRLQNAKCRGKMMLENGYAFLSNHNVEMQCNIGDIISIVPFDGELIINSSYGLKYKIDEGTHFSYGYPIGISNIATEEKVRIDITGGSALIFHYTN